MAPTIIGPSSASKTEALELLHSTNISSPDNESSFAGKVLYGTAGFREKVDVGTTMSRIMVRTAAFAVLRSLCCEGDAVGVMITASHNDESYNGVKVADIHGGMICASWEEKITWFVNHDNVDELWDWMDEQKVKASKEPCTETAGIDASSAETVVPLLYLGRDTRSHSSGFRDAMVQMAAALGARVVDLGVVTTPMLHHSVLHANFVRFLPKTLIPPRPNVDGYLELLAYSYTALRQTVGENATSPSPSTLLVDCACGVGFPALSQLVAQIQSIDPNARGFQITNGPGMGRLNHDCGSEHVQKQICEPTWYDPSIADLAADKEYCASFDGDADRIVFFASPTGSDNSSILLLDGDRIACLLCEFIQGELQILRNGVEHLPDLKLGVVQTAYANGASTHYLQEAIGDQSVCITKTGVKHLHAAAHDQFDVGIYFEANGHGTVLFGAKFYQAIDVAQQAVMFAHERPSDRNALIALQRLSLLPSLVNQAVGDALSDLLLVDAILFIKGWTVADWHSKQYQDLPSRQLKVRVADRTVIQTNHNETQCLAPALVQEELDQAMERVKGTDGVARTFIRPSGTEDVVRIYAEASTRAQADQLAATAAEIVYRLCNGIGNPPKIE